MNIFVFGSNLAGRHGKGAALWARKYRGAVYGEGIGLQGNSYAIPTKDASLRVLSLIAINLYVQDFIRFAALTKQHTYEVTGIGTGLAGYSPRVIAPMFKNAPDNVLIPLAWSSLLPGHPTWSGETSEPYGSL